MGDGHRDTAGTAAHDRRDQVFRLRHRQCRLEQQRSRHRALVPRLQEDRDTAAGRARSRRDVPRLDRRRTPDPARVEVSAARRQGHGDAPPRRHRCRHRTDGTAADGTRLPPRHARRRHQRTRLQLEPGQLAAGAGVRIARPQAGMAARRRYGDRDGAYGARGKGRDAVRITHRLAGVVEQQRGHLALGARQLGPAVPLRPRHRQAEEPDYERRRAGDADCACRRESANAVVRRQRPREGPGSILPALLPHGTRRQGQRLADTRRRHARHSVVAVRQIPGRYLFETGCAASRGAARRRRQARDAARAHRHLEAARDRLEAADADQDDGRGRQDRHLRTDVHTDEDGSGEEVPGRQQRVSGPADRQYGSPHVHRGSRRSPGPRGTRIHRRDHRWPRHAWTIKGVPGLRTTARWDATTRFPIRLPA